MCFIIGRVTQEIKPEWLQAAVIAVTTEDAKLVFVERPMKMNRCGYGLEIQAIHLDIENLPYEIEIFGGNTLNVVVEGHRPNCYARGERRNLKVQRLKY